MEKEKNSDGLIYEGLRRPTGQIDVVLDTEAHMKSMIHTHWVYMDPPADRLNVKESWQLHFMVLQAWGVPDRTAVQKKEWNELFGNPGTGCNGRTELAIMFLRAERKLPDEQTP